MADDIHIQQFQIGDLDALFSFLKAAYPSEPRKSERPFWAWHYLENPNINSNDIPIWVVKCGDEIVGQLATIPIMLSIDDLEIPALWMVDLIVAAEYRGKGLGKKLFLLAEGRSATTLALGFNEMSGGVLRSLKYAAVGGLHRYHILLNPGTATDKIAKYEAAGKIVNLLYTPFRRRVSSRLQDECGDVRRITNFDTAFDDLWSRASAQWRCAVVRDRSYLEWQFIKQPGKKFEILGVYEHDRLVGYIVLFFRKPKYGTNPAKAAIADIVYDVASSFDVVEVLLKAAVHLALEKQTGGLVTDVLDEHIERHLETLGFWRIKSAPQFMARTSEYQNLIYVERNWFLTRADCDVSIFELPNM